MKKASLNRLFKFDLDNDSEYLFNEIVDQLKSLFKIKEEEAVARVNSFFGWQKKYDEDDIIHSGTPEYWAYHCYWGMTPNEYKEHEQKDILKPLVIE